MTFSSAALTDIGRVRRRNEDAFIRNDTLRAFGVADGVGGLPGGAEAAQAAIRYLETNLPRSPVRRAKDLLPLVEGVNATVCVLGESINPSRGIATTLTFGVFQPERLLLAHVGDSRCYRLRGVRLDCLTVDHSIENEARRRRAQGEWFDYSPRHRRALARCIGQEELSGIEVNEHLVDPDDHFIFVTDGISGVLENEEMATILLAAGTLEERLRTLVQRVIEKGAPDNATAVLVAAHGSA